VEKSSAVAYKDFLRVFEQLSYKHSYSDTFSNFLDFSLYMLSPVKTKEDQEVMQRLENTYREKKEAEQMAQLFLDFTIAADNDGEGFSDVLGDLFMDLVSHGRNGQFFTPQPVCDMMAQMNYSSEIKEGMTVCDPACGSGRTLLSMGKLNRNLKFYGADNDITCCKMAVLNMMLNTMQGEIAWMNSLTMEHYKSWHIKRMLMGTHYLPVLVMSGKNETGFVIRKATEQEPVKVEVKQVAKEVVMVSDKPEQLKLFA
jgi:type I restriction-modification system DNA methylase subunit